MLSFKIKILHIENVQEDALMVRQALDEAGVVFEKLDISEHADYITALKQFNPDVILTNWQTPTITCLQALNILKEQALFVPLILVTDRTSEEVAINAMMDGVADYLLKDRLQRLSIAIFNAMEKAMLIAENKQYVTRVAKKRSFIKEVENVAHIGIVEVDLVTQERNWSDGVFEILGYLPGELESSFQSIAKCVHPDDVDQFIADGEYGMANLDVLDLQYRIVTPSKQVKFIHSKLVIIRNDLGKAVRAYGTIQDITELKVAGQKLNQASQELNRLFNTLDDVLFSRDMINNKLIQISPACEKLYGYKSEEFLNNPDLWNLTRHKDYKSVFLEMFEQLCRGETVVKQYKIVHKIKEIKWVESKVIPTIDKDGALIRIDGVTRDITENKRIELELQQSEQRFRELIDNSSDIIVLTNEFDQLIYSSENVSKIMGYTKQEYNNIRLKPDFVHEDDRALRGRVSSESHQKPGKIIPFCLRFKHSSGSWMWVEGTVVNLLHVPAVNGILANYRDVTERKNAEAQAERSRVHLRKMFAIQAAILDALPPQVALLDEHGCIVTVNKSWRNFAGQNNLPEASYSAGFNYLQVAGNATGLDNEQGSMIYRGIKDVMSGDRTDFSIEYLKDTSSGKKWFQLVAAPLAGLMQKGAVILNVDISDRKIIENNLVLSEQRYRQIAETAQEGIWVIDNELKTIFVNKKMCDMLEYEVHEIMGKHNYDFKHDSDKIQTLERLTQKELGVVETHESTFITKNGKRLVCNVSTNGIFDPGRTYVGTLAMITDITGRKVQEEALRKSEANLSAIIENTTDLVYSLDKDLKFITFNNQFKNAIKHVYGLDVVQGASVLDMLAGFDPVTAGKWKENYAKALAGETQQFVNEYPYGDGKIYLSYSINPIRERGKVIGLSCFSRDITKQKMDEVAIIKSEANLRSVFENTDLAIIMFDNELNIVSFNTNAAKQSAKFFGKKLKVGKSGYDYFIQKRLSFINNVIDRVKKKQPVSYETFYDVHDGVTQWFEVKSVGVFKDKKEMVGIILTLKNITERKNAELERERMTADMIKRNQDLEQFTYIISHNLRAPVANIKGLSGLLYDFEMPDPEYRFPLDALATSINHLDQVILDLNQILQAGKQVNDKKELVILPQLVDDIKLEIQLMMQQNSVMISCDFATIDELFTIKSYLYSIFQNLIINSIKYRSVSIAPVIHIKSVLDNDKVILYFEDNGKGIDLAKSGDQLYGLYKRFDFSVEGKGMGLFMVKKQVESLGGQINVKSQPGNGTQFIIELPL
ncbi:PAS domain S-box protein [Mucilaginibacter sp. OK283]|jgi:PAS domain S-box-containing protein|uniref:PAS domain S-box protein n=1 Tax=Mucilaginibacter sp. OK283 TaxID=1881049 RepID=UPI0008CD4A96|nr:PAS domain S-box protein [Mucilaginibacter sp. OK283]SEO41922.1 PAS domain S-box-containing protein [Mucilaginibacter sp. OK283]